MKLGDQREQMLIQLEMKENYGGWLGLGGVMKAKRTDDPIGLDCPWGHRIRTPSNLRNTPRADVKISSVQEARHGRCWFGCL